MARPGNTTRKTRLADVAKAASVSKAAAANVLNGTCQTARVSPETSCRIRKMARALNYVPDRTAQLLAGGSSHTIGILAPELMQPLGDIMAAVVVELNHELQRHGYQSLLGVCTEWDALPRKFINDMVDYRVDGLVLAGLNSTLDFHRMAAGIPPGMPVAVAGQLKGVDRDQVIIDKSGAMTALTDLCIRQGHRHFTFLRSAPGSNLAKLAGIQAALRANGLPWGPERVAETTKRQADAAETVARLLALRPAPTCILCSCDLFAIKVIRGLRQHGLRVPEDVSVTGYDDLPWIADLSDIPLTTIRQPGEEMGRRVARMVLKRIAEPGLAPETVVLQPKVVIRRSMGPAARIAQEAFA